MWWKLLNLSERKISLGQIIPIVCLLIIASSCFSLVSSPYYVGWKNEAGPSHSAQKGWRSQSLTALSLSWWEELLLAGKFLLRVEQRQPGHGTRQAKWSCLPFLPFFSYILFNGVAKMSLGVFVGSSIVIDLCGRTGKLQSSILSLFPRILGLFYLLLI